MTNNTQQLWAITPDGAAKMAQASGSISQSQIMAAQANAEAGLGVGELREWFSLMFNQRQESVISDKMAVISVYGGLLNDAAPIDLALGCTGYQEVIDDIATANQSADVDAIVLHINSPGGMCSGIPELVNAISNSEKPVFAYCESMACSAAYYIASSCSLIGASESAQVGNIGVVLKYADFSEAYAKAGVKLNVMTNEGADLKGTFHQMPMTDAQEQFVQDNINTIGADFINHVKSNRPHIDAEVERAGWYSGETALNMGLVDGIGTLSEFLTHLNLILDQSTETTNN